MKKTTVLAAFLILSLLGCNTTTGPDSGNTTQPPDPAIVADFPNRVGNRWIYSYYDSLSHHSDTVTVTIVGQTTIPGNIPATIWQREFRSYADTAYVTVSHDTSSDTVRIISQRNLDGQWDNTKFIFPLHVGSGWRGDFVSDTSTVIENRPITVIAGTFVNAFRIKERWGAFNDYGDVSTWLVPEVGAVKIHRNVRRWTEWANEVWELMSYNVSA